MKTVSIFGATGTVGQKALSLIAGTPGQYRVHTLAAGRDAAGLAAAARNAGARRAVLADAAHYSALKEHLSGTGIEAAAGQQALLEAAAEPVDVGVAAIVGVAGLAPTLVQAANAKVLALANKESVVCAGALLRDIVSSSGNQLIPVDSEHNALFQLLRGMGQDNTLRKITLTASGGPFRTRPLNTFAAITPAEAATFRSCRFFPDGQAFGLPSAHHACLAPGRSEILVYGSPAQCAEAFQTMQANEP